MLKATDVSGCPDVIPHPRVEEEAGPGGRSRGRLKTRGTPPSPVVSSGSHKLRTEEAQESCRMLALWADSAAEYCFTSARRTFYQH